MRQHNVKDIFFRFLARNKVSLKRFNKKINCKNNRSKPFSWLLNSWLTNKKRLGCLEAKKRNISRKYLWDRYPTINRGRLSGVSAKSSVWLLSSISYRHLMLLRATNDSNSSIHREIINFNYSLITLMRSIRYRKLMQGIGTLSEKNPHPFNVTVSPGVNC
jgi:hypothetical protein